MRLLKRAEATNPAHARAVKAIDPRQPIGSGGAAAEPHAAEPEVAGAKGTGRINPHTRGSGCGHAVELARGRRGEGGRNVWWLWRFGIPCKEGWSGGKSGGGSPGADARAERRDAEQSGGAPKSAGAFASASVGCERAYGGARTRSLARGNGGQIIKTSPRPHGVCLGEVRGV